MEKTLDNEDIKYNFFLVKVDIEVKARLFLTSMSNLEDGYLSS